MAQESQSTSPSLFASPPPTPERGHDRASATEPQPSKPAPQRIPGWLVRAELFMRVLLRMYIGLFVCYAPWSHAFWDQNPIVVQFPLLANGAVRGIVSGLGLLNLWIAFRTVLQRRDD